MEYPICFPQALIDTHGKNNFKWKKQESNSQHDSANHPLLSSASASPPSLKIEYDLSSAAANSCLAKSLGKMREQLALQESMEPAATGVHKKPCSLLHTNAVQMQVLPFSHLKRRGIVVAGFETIIASSSSSPGYTGALSEPTCTPMADLGCVRVISEGLCFSCHSGRQWLDHTHYICVSVYWCQIVACAVDPISKAPDSQLHQRRAIHMVCQRWLCRQNAYGAVARAAACPRDRIARTKTLAKGGGT